MTTADSWRARRVASAAKASPRTGRGRRGEGRAGSAVRRCTRS